MKDPHILPEDQELMREFAAIGALSTGTALEEQKRKMLVVQTRAILRNRKTAIDLDRSNSRLSKVVMALTIIQVEIAIFQAGLDILDSKEKILAGLFAAAFLALIFHIMNTVNKDIDGATNE